MYNMYWILPDCASPIILIQTNLKSSSQCINRDFLIYSSVIDLKLSIVLSLGFGINLIIHCFTVRNGSLFIHFFQFFKEQFSHIISEKLIKVGSKSILAW